MDLKDIFPPRGHVQHLYCDLCRKPLDLAYKDFDESVSGVNVRIFRPSGFALRRVQTSRASFQGSGHAHPATVFEDEDSFRKPQDGRHMISGELMQSCNRSFEWRR
jgi:hypothetical protein